MKTNQGALDRTARVVVGIQMMALGLSGAVAGGPGVALVVIGTVLLISGASGHCLFYRWMGWSTVPQGEGTGPQDSAMGLPRLDDQPVAAVSESPPRA
jgi:hypothetical protein